jgi:hypothetical protein
MSLHQHFILNRLFGFNKDRSGQNRSGYLLTKGVFMSTSVPMSTGINSGSDCFQRQ